MTISHWLKIFTWHIHGTYLYYLSKGNYDIYIPVTEKKEEGYYGRGQTFPFGDNVIEVPAEQVRNLEFDCILFQTNKNFLTDQYQVLSEQQCKLPGIYIEHDPPSDHPTNTEHLVRDPEMMLVHVTHFNRLMWNNTITPAKVIEHGVPENDIEFTGELPRGVVVVNHLKERGRKLGYDIFRQVAKEIPLDLIGMGSLKYGGIGEILHPELPAFIKRYRFFFNPIRYTSMGLAVCEAMHAGVPVVALATTENASVFTNGQSGFIHTDVHQLISAMRAMIDDRNLVVSIGAKGKAVARSRFSLTRFIDEWTETFHKVIEKKTITYGNDNSIY